MRNEICKMCSNTFSVYDSRPKATYCSIVCKRKDYNSWHAIATKRYTLPKKDKIKKIRFKWSDATQDQKIERLNKIFNKSVIKSENCWDWKGVSHHSGYCHMNYDGKDMGIHRVSWLLYHGNIPHGINILHKCDNRRCSNPDHLFLGTSKDNHDDMVNKGRKNSPSGENHHNSKLTSEKVKKIKELLILGVTSSRICRDFNMSKGAIEGIKLGKTWKHVLID